MSGITVGGFKVINPTALTAKPHAFGFTTPRSGTDPIFQVWNDDVGTDVPFEIVAAGVLADSIVLGTPMLLASGGTGLGTYTAGDTVYFAAGTLLTKVAIGGAGTIYRSSGTAPAWTTATFPATAAAGDLLHGSATNVWTALAVGATPRQLLQVNAAGTLPEWASNIDIPGTLDVTGAAVFDSTGTFTGDVVLGTIRRATSDATDNSAVFVTGGGAATSSRGAVLSLHGNEHASTGILSLEAGNVTGGSIDFYTGAANLKCRITDDGRLYGTALHNNAGSVTGTTTQYVASGTYTPTLTNVTNLDGSTAFLCQWVRVGNVVTVSGKVNVDPTAASLISLRMSLPIASNFAANEDCGGSACVVNGSIPGAIIGDAANDAALLRMVSTDTADQSVAFTFTYLVLA